MQRTYLGFNRALPAGLGDTHCKVSSGLDDLPLVTHTSHSRHDWD